MTGNRSVVAESWLAVLAAVALLVTVPPMTAKATVGVLSPVAGTGTPGATGDGGIATAAQLNHPRQLALDAAGNLFVAEVDNHRIRRIDPAGTIVTYAGSTAGFAGDDGPATAARFQRPVDVAVDATGNLFIADLDNHRIRRVDATTGIVTTVAGTSGGFSGDGGPATAAQLFAPYAVAVDADGDLYIGDLGNQRVRRVDAVSGIISTIAGTGTAGYSGDGGPATAAALYQPIDLALDAAGHLFIADFSNQRVRRVDASTGVITTVAGTGTAGFAGDGGTAITASLDGPVGVAVDGDADLLIADLNNRRVRRVDADTGFITTVAGFGQDGVTGGGVLAALAALAGPFAAIPDGAGGLFIADRLAHVVHRAHALPASCQDGAPAVDARLLAGNLHTPLGDDRLTIKMATTFAPPDLSLLDPLANGVRVVVTDALGSAAHLDATVAAGAYESATQTGWRANAAATRWTYTSAGEPHGIASMAISTYPHRPGVVRVKVRGRRASYGSMRVPLAAAVVLHPPLAPAGLCATASWPAVPPLTPSCRLSPAGRELRCTD